MSPRKVSDSPYFFFRLTKELVLSDLWKVLPIPFLSSLFRISHSAVCHLDCVIQVYYACAEPLVANMAARRNGFSLLRRCIFCHREVLTRNRDFVTRNLSHLMKENVFVGLSNRGIFRAKGRFTFCDTMKSSFIADNWFLLFICTYDFSTGATLFNCWCSSLSSSKLSHLRWAESNDTSAHASIHVLLHFRKFWPTEIQFQQTKAGVTFFFQTSVINLPLPSSSSSLFFMNWIKVWIMIIIFNLPESSQYDSCAS